MQNPFLFIFLFLFFIGKSGFSQLGCTDPQAINFDSNATMNDGSCEYATTNYSLQEIAILPNQVIETSGLAFFDHQLWTHNDGGNEDKIYQIDTVTGEVIQTVIIANSENTDWEDLAEDATHVYIGDFGNNEGDRTDLKIFKIPKSQLASGIATAEVIEFFYEDQIDFSPSNNFNNYDCEAFFFYNDSLHLFSKNWIDQKTKHYVIPSQPGSYEAKLCEVTQVQGYIAGGDISDDGVVALISYDSSASNFLWLFYDYQGTDFFSGNKRKISLGSVENNSQTEALVFRENGYGYISSERFVIYDAKLLSFQTSQWTNGISTSLTELVVPNPPFQIFPNPISDHVNILLEGKGSYEVTLFDLGGRMIQREKGVGPGILHWNLKSINLSAGMYYFLIKTEKNSWNQLFQIVGSN